MKRIEYIKLMACWFVLLMLQFQPLHAQRISHNFRNTSMSEALTTIAKSTRDYRINFMYNELEDFTVTTQVVKRTVPEAIQQIIGLYPMKMTIDGKNIFVECTQKGLSKMMGRVVDSAGIPVPYANVVICSSVDSSFVMGAVTDNDGRFSMKCLPSSHQLLRISCMGYKTLFQKCSYGKEQTIHLAFDTKKLNEVVVRASKPALKVTNEGIVADVHQTVLAKLGTTYDVLNQIPFVSANDRSIEVIGGGTPIVFVNSKQVYDLKELRDIQSDEIKNVEVILHPGSMYSASTQSVIRINTLKATKDMLGLTASLYSGKNRDWTHAGNLKAVWRKNGWESFASLNMTRSEYTQNQDNTLSFVHEKQEISMLNSGKINGKSKSFDISVGINRLPTKNNEFGVKYTLYKVPKNNTYTSYSNQSAFGNQMNLYDSKMEREAENLNHDLSAFWDYKISNQSKMHIDGVVLSQKMTSDETEVEVSSSKENIVSSKSKSTSLLCAVKGYLDISLPLGKITSGIECSYTNNEQKYEVQSNSSTGLSDNSNQVKQTAINPFVSYKVSWGDFNMNLGVRYEYLKYDYFVGDKKIEEQSKNYSNFFPVASLNYTKGAASFSLAYRTIVSRPSYWNLRNSISYNNQFSYESGNPELKQTYTHQISLLMKYHDFALNCDFSKNMNEQIVCIQHYQDMPVVLFSPVNHDRKVCTLYLSYTPTIHIWKPSFGVGYYKQFFSFAERQYNKPRLIYSWKNTIDFPHNLLLCINFNGKSAGYWQAEYNRSFANLSCYVRKSIKAWEFYVGGNNLLKTDKERWHLDVNDIIYEKSNDLDSFGVYARVVYHINSVSTKSRISEAGQSERNRL